MPERFTAPVSGLYHFGSGTPHHESQCDDSCPLHADFASKALAVRDEHAPAARVVEIDIAAFTAAVTEVWRAIRVTLEPVFRAVIDAVRPLVALLEEYPELAEVPTQPEPSGCHHLCGYAPPHECLGDADGEFAYEPGGHAIPMCAPCQGAADQFQPLRNRSTLDGGARSAFANWPEQSTTCAHVCGADPDHHCQARATEYLAYPLPSGGTRRMPMCAPCHASETADVAAVEQPASPAATAAEGMRLLAEAQAALPTVAEASTNLTAVAEAMQTRETG